MNDTELDQLLDAWRAPSPPPSLRAKVRAGFPADKRRRLFGLPLRWVVAFGVGAAAVAIGTSLVDGPVLGRTWGRLDDGTYFKSTRLVEPPLAKLKWWRMGGGTDWGKRLPSGVVMRAVQAQDPFSRAHTGYEWGAESLGAGQYWLTVEALDHSTKDGPLVPLPRAPASRVVQDSEPFEIDLFVSGKERVYDRIELSSRPFPDEPSHQPLPATELRLRTPKLYLNGQFAADEGGLVEARGTVVFVELPGRGAYVIALSPLDRRYVEAGRVNGNTIEFRSGGDQFRILNAKPAVTGRGQPVFVFHQESSASNPESPASRKATFGSGAPPPPYAR